MEREALDILCQWESQRAKLLLEIGELTGQLAEAMGRNDRMSVSVVLNMRQEPLRQAEEIDGKARDFLLTLPETDAPRALELLRGAPAQAPQEERLALLVKQNREKLSRIRAEDRRLSLLLGGRHSFYEKFRE